MKPNGKSRHKALPAKSYRSGFWFFLLVPLICGMPARGDAQRLQHTQAYWESQIRKVHLRTQEYRVEDFLPPLSPVSQDFNKDGMSYTLTYALDEHWSVALTYDRSGFHAENNPYMVMGYPNDRMIAPPRLIAMNNEGYFRAADFLTHREQAILNAIHENGSATEIILELPKSILDAKGERELDYPIEIYWTGGSQEAELTELQLIADLKRHNLGRLTLVSASKPLKRNWNSACLKLLEPERLDLTAE